MSLRIAYRMRPDSWQGRVVALFTGRPVHVELVFSDGMSFRAVDGAPCAFVAMPTADVIACGDWRVVSLAALGLDEARARAYCHAVVGARYDMLRSVAGWWGWELDRVDAANCCEVTACALVAAGAPPSLAGRPSTTPRRLMDAVDDLLGHVIVAGAVRTLATLTPPEALL